ncbi:MAG: hypothetical protein LBT00_15280 [Spirochaetaceae bacterium]|nr:hypothetical protein [Spirochaetaceae bacterium]
MVRHAQEMSLRGRARSNERPARNDGDNGRGRHCEEAATRLPTTKQSRRGGPFSKRAKPATPCDRNDKKQVNLPAGLNAGGDFRKGDFYDKEKCVFRGGVGDGGRDGFCRGR